MALTILKLSHLVTSLVFAPEISSNQGCGGAADTPATRLISGHEDGQMRSWDVDSGACLRAHRKKGAEVTALTVVVRSDGQLRALAGDLKGRLIMWDFESSAKAELMDVPLTGKVTAMASPPQDPKKKDPRKRAIVLAACADGGITVIDFEAKAHAIVLAACADGGITVIDVEAKAKVLHFVAHQGMSSSGVLPPASPPLVPSISAQPPPDSPCLDPSTSAQPPPAPNSATLNASDLLSPAAQPPPAPPSATPTPSGIPSQPAPPPLASPPTPQSPSAPASPSFSWYSLPPVKVCFISPPLPTPSPGGGGPEGWMRARPWTASAIISQLGASAVDLHHSASVWLAVGCGSNSGGSHINIYQVDLWSGRFSLAFKTKPIHSRTIFCLGAITSAEPHLLESAPGKAESEPTAAAEAKPEDLALNQAKPAASAEAKPEELALIQAKPKEAAETKPEDSALKQAKPKTQVTLSVPSFILVKEKEKEGSQSVISASPQGTAGADVGGPGRGAPTASSKQQRAVQGGFMNALGPPTTLGAKPTAAQLGFTVGRGSALAAPPGTTTALPGAPGSTQQAGQVPHPSMQLQAPGSANAGVTSNLNSDVRVSSRPPKPTGPEVGVLGCTSAWKLQGLGGWPCALDVSVPASVASGTTTGGKSDGKARGKIDEVPSPPFSQCVLAAGCGDKTISWTVANLPHRSASVKNPEESQVEAAQAVDEELRQFHVVAQQTSDPTPMFQGGRNIHSWLGRSYLSDKRKRYSRMESKVVALKK
eukprot:gene7131-237_t